MRSRCTGWIDYPAPDVVVRVECHRQINHGALHSGWLHLEKSEAWETSDATMNGDQATAVDVRLSWAREP